MKVNLTGTLSQTQVTKKMIHPEDQGRKKKSPSKYPAIIKPPAKSTAKHTAMKLSQTSRKTTKKEGSTPSPQSLHKTPTLTPENSPTTRKTIRKTPATKMTPKMKRTLNFLADTPTPKKFTIGAIADKLGNRRGEVKEAKRKLEEKIRKERRESQLELVRKPLLVTPNNKRSRAEDGVWDTDTMGPGVSETPPRRTQTPMNSFLVPQTIEERRQALARRPTSMVTIMKEMSASPVLKKIKKRRQLDTKKTMESDKNTKQKTVAVSTISKYFESGQMTGGMSIIGQGTGNKYNNNGVYLATANQTLPRSSSQADPEMAVQSVAAGRPIVTEGCELSGHMTTEEPMGREKPNFDQNMRDSSHL